MSLLKFPYTNLHELNLDWIIEQLNKDGAVLSVNGKHGTVTLTGQDIDRTPNNAQTVEQALASQGSSIQSVQTKIGVTALPTTAQTITGAIAEHETDITGINNKLGNTSLPTTAQTITGAIAETDNDVNAVSAKVGNTPMTTSSTTVTGAIAELNAGKLSAGKILTAALAANGSVTFAVPNNARAFIIFTGAANSRCGMYHIWASSAGNVGSAAAEAATDITFDTSVTNRLTVTAAGALSYCVILFTGVITTVEE